MSRAIKTPQAERDLIADYARIALDKIDPAVRFLKVADESFELLARMPTLGRVWETKNRQLTGVRVYPLRARLVTTSPGRMPARSWI